MLAILGWFAGDRPIKAPGRKIDGSAPRSSLTAASFFIFLSGLPCLACPVLFLTPPGFAEMAAWWLRVVGG
jgi:hypothetical protein